MGWLSDLRQKKRQQTFREQNIQTISQALQEDIPKDELVELIDLLNEPEMQEPLFANVEALSTQKNLDDVLRMRFKMQVSSVLSDPSDKERMADILNRFENSTPLSAQKSTRLIDRLQFEDRDTPVSPTEQIRERIRQTRNDIKDRVSFHSRKVHNHVRPLADMANEGLKGLTQSVKDRVQAFKDTYRTKTLAYTNEQNWKIALDKGVTTNQIERVSEQLSLPEVRYGLIQHADTLFTQEAMTPQLAANIYYGIEPYLNADNPEHEGFLMAFNQYAESVLENDADRVAESVSTDQQPTQNEPIFDTAVVHEASSSDKMKACETIVNYTMLKYGLTDYSLDETNAIIAKQVDTLQETTSFVGFNKDGAHVWAVETDKGIERLDDASVEASILDIYTAQAEQNAQENGYTKGIEVKEYGQDGNTLFADSLLMQQLMNKYDISNLQYAIETSIDRPDIKQAELLTMENGELIWGVPFEGDMHKIKDSEMEQTFVEQYNDTMKTKYSMSDVIPFPEPPETDDTVYFDRLSTEFNQEYDEEERLMQHHNNHAPSDEDIPPLPDDADMPPLSFDGLETKMHHQQG